MLREQRENDRAFSMTPLETYPPTTPTPIYAAHRTQPSSSSYAPLMTHDDTEFDPYTDTIRPAGGHDRDQTLVDSEAGFKPTAHEHHRSLTVVSVGGPPPPIEVGYGGGQWTHQDISEEEKARLGRRELDEGGGGETISSTNMTEAERTRRLEESKSPSGPSTVPRYEPALPRYALKDTGPVRESFEG